MHVPQSIGRSYVYIGERKPRDANLKLDLTKKINLTQAISQEK